MQPAIDIDAWHKPCAGETDDVDGGGGNRIGT